MGNHRRALRREKNPTSRLCLKGCVRHTGGGVQLALDMNPQMAKDLRYVYENHCQGSGNHGCGQVCLGMLQSLKRRGGTRGHQQLKGREKSRNLRRRQQRELGRRKSSK